ncbi:MAG: metallophosphoesterase family protein [Candidatus Aenigmarchaeota archaeon]|nr:metallophosphoesterase family protein [Candidatus Aenigmarchaeota archaeon]
MAVALISDLHANIDALEAVLADIDRRGIGEIRCLGDVVGYNAAPNEVVDLLRDRGIPTIQGNHDHYLLQGIPADISPGAYQALRWTKGVATRQTRAYVGTKPQEYLDRERRVLLIHGSPADPLEHYLCLYPREAEKGLWDRVFTEVLARSDRAAALYTGHTHLPFKRELPDGRLVANVGSVGQPRDGDPRACYCVTDWTFPGTEFVRVSYDVAKAQERIRRVRLPERNAARLALGK